MQEDKAFTGLQTQLSLLRPSAAGCMKGRCSYLAGGNTAEGGMTCTAVDEMSSISISYKLPPSPPKLPIIGNLHQLLGKPRHHALWKLSQKYGPVMLIYIGSKPYIVISSSGMAKQVLKTQDHICCSRTVFQATKRLTYNYLDIAFSPYGNHWREMRKVLVSEFLGLKRAKLFNRVLVTEIETMLRSLSSNTEVNLKKVFMEMVKGMICKVAFGNNYREQQPKGPSLEVMLDEIAEMFNGSVGDNFPWLGHIIDRFSGFNGSLEKVFSYLDSYIEAVIAEHENHAIAEMSDDDKDFVHAILELSSKEASGSEYRLTKQDIKALVMDALAGGIDSTVVAMVWAMSEIVRNGRVMQKLQNEIRNCTGRIEKVKEMDVTKMKYLKMVVKETLRLHPPAPLLVPHESIGHCKIGGYDVFPKTTILINGWGIGRDRNTWGENAGEFYPERFDDDENENVEVDFEMIPFGGGRRTCPAIKTAPATVELVIANLLYWFDWEVPKGNDESLNLEEKGSLVVHKKYPLCLVPTKHNWED
ncbi:hypothetical protein OSB04_026952 [Centaurea solstitialis]|uniref:Cytochrome P450 n=1 Tax=Centaurea solstitialis TaxID=347529 RepID=A0AA38SPX8_9ASTR|nr:hypothetical protein OSB04_026952 [Centaurea solstitialis]